MTRSKEDEAGEAFWNEVQAVAHEWEQLGWLHKYRDQHGKEWWELTPLGRQKRNLPPLRRQCQ
jgi:hypothetical protein